MKNSMLILLLFFLLVIKVIYGEGGNFNVAVSIGFDSDGDGIPDETDTDDDNDGILDGNDPLTGNSSFVNSNTITVNVTVNNDINLTQSFSGVKTVKIMNFSTAIVEFEFNFSAATLNLANITVNIQTDTTAGSVLVKGIDLEAQNKTKTVYVDDLHSSTSVCIKDQEINSISDISSACNEAKETLVSCNAVLNNGYICKDIGTKYNVSGLNNSGVKEYTLGVGEGVGGGGGGGGGGEKAVVVSEKVAGFSIDKHMIKVVLKPGEDTRDMIEISNTGETTLDISFSVAKLEKFLFLDRDSITLESGESKIIGITIAMPSNQEHGVYVGKIVIKSESLEKVINVIIEVESEEPLFDVSIEIPPRFKAVFPGEEVLAQIIIYNLGLAKRADTILDYSIKDMEGNEIATEQKTIAVETQASLVLSFELPSALEAGDYVFEVNVKYDDSFATATDMFAVVERPVMLSKSTSMSLLIGILSLILLCFVIFIVASIIDLKYHRLLEERRLRKKIAKKPLLIKKILAKKPKLPTAAQILEEVKKEKITKKGIEEMVSSISRGLLFLKYGDIRSARSIYIRSVAIYRTLSGKEKRRIYPSLKKLYDKIMLFSKRE